MTGLEAVFLPAWPDNPYQEILATALEAQGVRVRSLPRQGLFLPAILREGVPDVVHLHAPDHFVVYRATKLVGLVALVALIAQLLVLRAFGARIVWTAHDALNHEGNHPWLDRASRRWTSVVASAVFVHGEAARRLVAERFLGGRVEKLHAIPFGPYFDRYARPGPPEDRREAREALGLPVDARILLLFGHLRRHKGVGPLIDAFRRHEREGVLLVVVGEPFTPDIEAEIVERIGGRSDVELRAGYVPDADVERYLRAADVLVCPFTSSLTSSSVALAMSFGRACIAPRLGGIPEMLGEDGGLLYDPTDPDGLFEALGAAIDARQDLDAMGARARDAIRARDWPSIAKTTADVYRACLPGKRGGS